MEHLIDLHLKAGMHLTTNNHDHLIVLNPDTDMYHVLTGMTKTDREYLEMAKHRHRNHGLGVRKRFIH